jgi:hypothetical protein
MDTSRGEVGFTEFCLSTDSLNVGIRRKANNLAASPTANPSYRYHFMRWLCQNYRMTDSLILSRAFTEPLTARTRGRAGGRVKQRFHFRISG